MMDITYITTTKEEYDKNYKQEMINYKKKNCGEDYINCKGCNIYTSIEKGEEEPTRIIKNYKISSAKRIKGKCKMLGGIRRFKMILIKS